MMKWNSLGSVAAATTLVGVLFIGSYRATGNQQGGPEGLTGILPAQPPAGLVPSDLLEQLGPNWSAWSAEYTDLVNKLYQTGNSLDQQKSLIKSLEVKQQTLSTALGDSRYSMIWDGLGELQGKLQRRLAVMNATLATLEMPATTGADAAVGQIAVDVDSVNNLLSSYAGGDAWKTYFKLDQLTPEAVVNHDSETLGKLADRMEGKTAYNDDQLAFVQQPAFINLAGSLRKLIASRTVENADLALKTSVAQLVTAIELADGNPIESETPAVSVSQALASVQQYAGDGGAKLISAIQQNYDQPNFVVTFPQALINDLNNEGRIECGPVRDCILGARVSGTQQTNTDVDLKLVPSDDSIVVGVSLSGTTSSSTRGVTEQATIFTKGNHSFNGYKTLRFDGYQVSTSGGSSIGVNPHNYNYAARIHNRGLFGIIGKIGDDIALDRANDMRGQAEAIAASRVRDRVGPEFDSGISDLAGKTNTKLNETNSLLEALDYAPAYVSTSSTSHSAFYGSRLGHQDYLAAPSAPALPATSHLMTMQIHQSAINNLFKRNQFLLTFFDRDISGIDPQTSEIVQYTIPELVEKIKADVHATTGKDLNIELSQEVLDNPNKFTLGLGDKFAHLDPVTVVMSNDQLLVTLKGAIEIPKEGGESDKLPYAEIPLLFNVTETDSSVTLSLDDDHLLRSAKLLNETPFSDADSKPRLIATRIFKDRVVKEFTTAIEDTVIEKSPMMINGKPVSEDSEYQFELHTFDLTDGWLNITGRPRKKSSTPATELTAN